MMIAPCNLFMSKQLTFSYYENLVSNFYFYFFHSSNNKTNIHMLRWHRTNKRRLQSGIRDKKQEVNNCDVGNINEDLINKKYFVYLWGFSKCKIYINHASFKLQKHHVIHFPVHIFSQESKNYKLNINTLIS